MMTDLLAGIAVGALVFVTTMWIGMKWIARYEKRSISVALEPYDAEAAALVGTVMSSHLGTDFKGRA